MAWKIAKTEQSAFGILGCASSNGTIGIRCRRCNELCTVQQLPVVSDGRGNVFHPLCAAQQIEEEIDEMSDFLEELVPWLK